MGHDAVWNGKQVLIFESNVLLPSSGPNLKPQAYNAFIVHNDYVVQFGSILPPQMLQYL